MGRRRIDLVPLNVQWTEGEGGGGKGKPLTSNGLKRYQIDFIDDPPQPLELEVRGALAGVALTF